MKHSKCWEERPINQEFYISKITFQKLQRNWDILIFKKMREESLSGKSLALSCSSLGHCCGEGLIPGQGILYAMCAAKRKKKKAPSFNVCLQLLDWDYLVPLWGFTPPAIFLILYSLWPGRDRLKIGARKNPGYVLMFVYLPWFMYCLMIKRT